MHTNSITRFGAHFWSGGPSKAVGIAYLRPYRNIITANKVVQSLSIEDSTTATESDKKLIKKYKVNQGGDVNLVNLLGTVLGVKISPMYSNPERDWAVIFLHTQIPRFSGGQPHTSIEDASEPILSNPTHAYNKTSSRIHVFDPRLLNHAKRIRLGDRLFVHGFLAYFRYENSTNSSYTTEASNDTNKLIPNTCAVVAKRIVYMGHAGMIESTDTQDYLDK